MERKNTLIKLLVILLILFILLAIAKPIVIGIINDSRRAADISTIKIC